MLELERIRSFQTEQLESRNDAKNTATPREGYVTEWALVEIVILLTAIRDRLGESRTEGRRERAQS